jgi:hypothetical protein
VKRINRLFAVVVALLALGVAAAFAAHTPAGALRSAKRATVTPAGNDPMTPGWLCRAQRDAMGRAPFNQLWAGNAAAPRSAMGRCVTSLAEAAAEGKAARTERTILAAYQACRRMLSTDRAAFRKRFGTNTRTSNALGKCVRARTRSS